MNAGTKYRVVDDSVRMEIARLYAAGWKAPDIAATVELHVTSVYRELNRGLTDELDSKGRFIYDIEKAKLSAAKARANKGKYKGKGVDGRSTRHGETAGKACFSAAGQNE